MMKRPTASSHNTRTSEMDKLLRDKFVLLAKVGQRKREASRFQDEAEFWFGIVTELLALLGEAMEKLRLEHPSAEGDEAVATLTSKQLSLVRQLLSFSPPASESQERVLRLLDSDGLGMMTAVTGGVYVIPSSRLILESVERIIAATKEQDPKLSSS